MSQFKATPTMWEVMQSNAYVRVIAGAVGSGKSVMCCHELVRLALGQAPNADGERKTRSLIVRNTADQLRSTTMRTFFDWFPVGVWGYYKVTDHTFYMHHNLPDGTKLNAEFMFIALDTPEDVRKALSLEATFLWGNEWRELNPRVVDGLLMRLRRYPSRKDGGPTRSGALFDTNMPDVDTWHHDKLENPPENWFVAVQPPAILSFEEYLADFGEDPDMDEAIIGSDDEPWWINPHADNINNLDPNYYKDILPGKTDDFIRVYLRCLYGRSLSGVPVYDKTFHPETHIAREPYTPLKSSEYPVVIGLDFGRTPAAVMAQRNVRGQVIVFGEVTSSNMGIETFLNMKLLPELSSNYNGCSFLVAPDPAGWAKQQIGEISPVDVIKREGFKVIKPNTNNPDRRIQGVERLLSLITEGKPMFIVNQECRELIKGFRYGYRYKLNKQGHQDNKPEKNEYSHVHDALQYCCNVLEANQSPGELLSRGYRREVRRVAYAYA